jgi:hypothetical protein
VQECLWKTLGRRRQWFAAAHYCDNGGWRSSRRWYPIVSPLYVHHCVLAKDRARLNCSAESPNALMDGVMQCRNMAFWSALPKSYEQLECEMRDHDRLMVHRARSESVVIGSPWARNLQSVVQDLPHVLRSTLLAIASALCSCCVFALRQPPCAAASGKHGDVGGLSPRRARCTPRSCSHTTVARLASSITDPSRMLPANTGIFSRPAHFIMAPQIEVRH